MTGTLRPRLVLLQGGRILAVREVPPDHEWQLGRRPDSPLPLNERSISRQHARLYCDGAGTHLEDLGTPNGTWVDGAPVRGSVLLRDGQVIRLGQSTNPEPLLLRFEDPASRLLDTLARVPLEEPASAPPPPAARERMEPPPLPALPSPAAVGDEAAEGLAPPEALGAPAPPAPLSPPPLPPPTEEEGGAAPPEDADVSPARPFLGLGAKAIAGAVLAFVAVFWLVWALKSTQKPWQSVRVEPLRVQAGTKVAVRGSEVEPSGSFAVLLEDHPATIEEVAPGTLVFTVPELLGAEAGTRTVTFRVQRQGIVVLRQSLQYETNPKVQRVEPPEAAVGDVVALVGGGFAGDPSRVQVRVGGLKATVVAATPERLDVRVPVATRDAKVQAPVVVVIEGLSSAPAYLVVRRREAPCYALTFSARTAAPRVYEVWHSFGPAVLVEGAVRSGEPAEADLPAPVGQALAALRAAFAPAKADAAVRFEVREWGKSAGLVATGPGAPTRAVTSLGPAVRQLVRERLPELRQPELLLYWQAAILNEMVDLFVRKKAPHLLPGSEPVGALLRRLHELNGETGGQGCPAEAEIGTITDEERRAFEAAAFRVPPRFGDVAGVWEGSFEATGDEPSSARLEMKLELQQSGTSVKGRVFLFEVRGPGIRWSPPPLEGLTGRVRLDAGTSVELRLPPVPPHDIAQLSGAVAEDAMQGTYRTSRGRQGRFQLSYKEAAP
jgi:hypothetical protein